MAVALRHLSRRALLVSHRTTTKRKSASPPWQLPGRKFSTTTSGRTRQSQPGGGVPGSTEYGATAGQADRAFTIEDLDEDARAKFDRSSPEEQQELRDALRALAENDSTDSSNAISDEVAADIAREVSTIDREDPLRIPDTKPPKNHGGFWADGEDDEFSNVEDQDDDFQDDDMTSIAHGQLDLHRDMRQYQRRIAWDMPLLRKFAKPFEPPALTSPLRFRYTTYMGEEHPAAKKVVVELCVSDLDKQDQDQRPTRIQKNKLIKLVGVRYNPSTDTIKMSSEKFETQAQNKRYLGDLVNNLLAEATDPTKDTFEDIPFDFRHHKPRKVFNFPEAWKLGGSGGAAADNADAIASSDNVQRLIDSRQSTTAANKQRARRALSSPSPSPYNMQTDTGFDNDDPNSDADLDGDLIVQRYLIGVAAHQAKYQAGLNAGTSGRVPNPAARQGGKRALRR